MVLQPLIGLLYQKMSVSQIEYMNFIHFKGECSDKSWNNTVICFLSTTVSARIVYL
jgi:hypothetical protein